VYFFLKSTPQILYASGPITLGSGPGFTALARGLSREKLAEAPAEERDTVCSVFSSLGLHQ